VVWKATDHHRPTAFDFSAFNWQFDIRHFGGFSAPMTFAIRILAVHFSAFLLVFFGSSFPRIISWGTLLKRNIDGAYIQVLLLLIQCFISARRYGSGWEFEVLNGGPLIFFLLGIVTLFDSFWNEKRKCGVDLQD